MFEKKKDTTTEPNVVPAKPPVEKRASAEPLKPRNVAVIGETISVKGNISGGENLVIEGHVDGAVDLSNHDLTIGQSGRVDADLTAKTVMVDGQVTGDIAGQEKVVVSKSGRVQGNITAPRVTLEDGAKFKGTIDMDPGEDAKSAAPKATPDAESGKAQAVG